MEHSRKQKIVVLASSLVVFQKMKIAKVDKQGSFESFTTQIQTITSNIHLCVCASGCACVVVFSEHTTLIHQHVFRKPKPNTLLHALVLMLHSWRHMVEQMFSERCLTVLVIRENVISSIQTPLGQKWPVTKKFCGNACTNATYRFW